MLSLLNQIVKSRPLNFFNHKAYGQIRKPFQYSQFALPILKNIKRIEIGKLCWGSFPCTHTYTIILTNGEKSSGKLSDLEIHALMESSVREKIVSIWQKEHFDAYAQNKFMRWLLANSNLQAEEKILNDLCMRMHLEQRKKIGQTKRNS